MPRNRIRSTPEAHKTTISATTAKAIGSASSCAISPLSHHFPYQFSDSDG